MASAGSPIECAQRCAAVAWGGGGHNSLAQRAAASPAHEAAATAAAEATSATRASATRALARAIASASPRASISPFSARATPADARGAWRQGPRWRHWR